MWLLDWSMRVFELREKLDGRLKALGNGCLTLSLPRKRLSGCACHSPLAHFYIHHSGSSIREIHPFTTVTHLASKKSITRAGDETIRIQFLFKKSESVDALQVLSEPLLKKSSQWTSRLASLVDEEKAETVSSTGDDPAQWRTSLSVAESKRAAEYGVETPLRLEGPYFTPADPERFETVVCLVAGTGLSGAIAITAAYQAHRARSQSMTETPTATTATTCRIATDSGGQWRRCVVVWTVREKDAITMPFIEALKCDGLEIQTHKTGGTQPRPDMSRILKEVCGESGGTTWCYLSGPSGFISAAEQACGQIEGLSWFAARWD
ncbi:hypothetical protein MMC25_004385 [Agyrium rufum]|nr:hypothetical protein [Agyrium rufum]